MILQGGLDYYNLIIGQQPPYNQWLLESGPNDMVNKHSLQKIVYTYKGRTNDMVLNETDMKK